MKRIRIDKQTRFDIYQPYEDDQGAEMSDEEFAEIKETIRKFEALQERLFNLAQK